MTNTILYILWGAMYALCAGLGVFAIPTAVGVAACVAFFVPPVILLCKKQEKNLKIIRNLSLIWLSVTLILLICNILSVALSATAGRVLYYLMAVVSSPMVCGQFWVLGLFGWACLLMGSLKLLKR